MDRLRFHSRHFVLLTDHLDKEKWPDDRVLNEYRYQHVIEGTAGFRWIKNVGTVAPVFLHTPHRIAALGLVLVLALMVRNFIQWSLRRRLAETDEYIPDRLGNDTQKPTTETAFIPFATIQVVRIFYGDQLLERRLTPLNDHVRTVLRMLGVDAAAFSRAGTAPTPVIRGGPSETPGM